MRQHMAFWLTLRGRFSYSKLHSQFTIVPTVSAFTPTARGKCTTATHTPTAGLLGVKLLVKILVKFILT
jgi:hypothetical protein